MPLLKFQTKLVNGRTNIVYETDRQKNASKKLSYKTKVQKYPLRNMSTDEGKNFEKEISAVNNDTRHDLMNNHRNKFQKRSQSSTSSRNIDLDLYDISNKRIINNNSNKKPLNSKKESLFNFLKKDIKLTSNENSKTDLISKKDKNTRGNKTLSDEDIDDIMKQVVLNNKDKLTDDQLVDLLAKIYIEAKKDFRDDKYESRNDEMKIDERKEMLVKKKNQDVPRLEMEDSEKPIKQFVTSKAVETVLPLSMAQKKQLQWDQERQELAKITSYNPWGRPGCGAPPKDSYEVYSKDPGQSRPAGVEVSYDNTKRIPSARIPEPTGLSQAEIKRRQWVSELNEQVAEKERLKFQINTKSSNLPDYNENRSSSNFAGELSPGHGRGKGLANLNQVTSEELTLKRHKQMEQQEAFKRQIEEKELIKRLEKEKKALLDKQEEMRINKEKQQLDSQFMSETARVKQKEDESGRRLAQLRAQVEEAERTALLEKRMKRLQHLELAGHDTRQLRAGLVVDQMSGRLDASTEFLSEEHPFSKNNQVKEFGNQVYDHLSRKRFTEDHAIQTDVEENPYRYHHDDLENNQIRKEYRNKSVEIVKEGKKVQRVVVNTRDNQLDLKKKDKKHDKVSSATFARKEEKTISKRPESIGSRKPWGVKKLNKKYIPQSKRDPFYSVNKNERESNKHERVNKILAQVRANLDRIPDSDVADGHLSQRHKRCDDRRANDSNKENIDVNHGTYNLKNENYYQMEDEHDRVQASVRYKDSYRQPEIEKYQRAPPNQSHRNAWTPNKRGDDWDDAEHEIVRTTDILDPSTADQRCPVSREDTGRERARNSYYKSQNPAQLGEPLDKKYNSFKPRYGGQEKHDPLSYPLGHPTNRQNTIMKQLSDIREDLRMRQKEIETSLSFNEDFN